MIPLLFMVAESLASILPPPFSPSLSCPVPRGPPLFPGPARVEQPQSGASREQTRVSLTAFLLHSHSTQSADSDGAPPHLARLPLSGAHRHTAVSVHSRAYTCTCTSSPPSYQLEIHVLSFSPPSFQSVHSASDPGRRRTTMGSWKAISVH